MFEIRIIKEPIAKSELKKIAEERFGDMVKAVIDVELGIMALGGELHADEEALLLEQRSKQENLWGINIYPEKSKDEWIEYDSMINIRPRQDNRSRGVENRKIQEKIVQIIERLIIH